jgi:glycosyltransferase involved in cell wall biosynthesis
MIDRRNDMGFLAEKAKQLGVPFHSAMEEGPFSIQTLKAFRKVITEGKYDIVHTHEYKSNALAWIYHRRFGYKVVATTHGYNRTTFREYLYYRFERWILKSADAIVTPTQEMHRRILQFGISPSRVYVIPNGVEIASRNLIERKPRSSRISLLYLGRLSEEKDPSNLLKAMAELRKRNLDVELVLAGDGPERGNLETQKSELGLSDSVALPGYIGDVSHLLANADILVSPSRTECMPNSILEAMGSGVPVVGTDVGGVGEMIRNGIDGLLCPPRDSKALADAIERLIADASLAKRLAESARDRVLNEFSFKQHMKATLDLYFHLLK